jgi:predicted RNase H-like HicB family nuclease
MNYKLSAIITKDEDLYVARCPEVGVTSQGETLDEARANLKEAVELYIESFGDDDLKGIKEGPLFTTIEVAA